MKLLLLPSLLLVTANLIACGSGGDGPTNPISNQPGKDTPAPIITSSSRSPTGTNSSAGSNLVLQNALQSRILEALESEDPDEFLNLYYLEDVDAETIDQLESIGIAYLYEETVDDITFAPPQEEYESFDVDYRYTPNLEILGEVTLHFENADPQLNTSATFAYGLADGDYMLAGTTREFIQYDGPRNRQLSYSIYGQVAPATNQFHVTADYKVSGLSRSIDLIQDAGSFSTFPGQYIETLSVDQVVGTADFYVQVYDDGELIYTSSTENDGATVQYVNTDY